MLALPTRALGSGGLILQRSEGSGMLIGDPLGEGSTASSTDNELWSPLILQNERELSLFFFFLSWLSRKFPPNLGQVEFTVVTGELERNERACLSLTRVSLSP